MVHRKLGKGWDVPGVRVVVSDNKIIIDNRIIRVLGPLQLIHRKFGREWDLTGCKIVGSDLRGNGLRMESL